MYVINGTKSVFIRFCDLFSMVLNVRVCKQLWCCRLFICTSVAERTSNHKVQG